jgi:creatinine amidohydrolase
MSNQTIPELAAMTWMEARDALRLHPIGLLPIGAIEAHGPHLPLDSDVIIASAMAHAGGRMLHQRGLPSIVLPAISYSVSFAGACFPGTTPVTSASLESYLHDLLSLHATQGYRAICLCNAHLEPAHVQTIERVARSVTQTTGIPVVFPDQRLEPWASRLGDEFSGGSRHAGMYETSIVMATKPDAVRRVHLEELEPVWIDLPAALKAGARDFAEAGAELGYFGDPAQSSETHGQALLEILGTMIAERSLEAITGAGS